MSKITYNTVLAKPYTNRYVFYDIFCYLKDASKATYAIRYVFYEVFCMLFTRPHMYDFGDEGKVFILPRKMKIFFL